ncbi:hypothetical protein ABK040_008432 [Willaertia magna]
MNHLKRLGVNVKDHIAIVELNQVKRMNAMDKLFFDEMYTVFKSLDAMDDVYVIIIKGSFDCQHFSVGLDLKSVASDLLPSSTNESGEEISSAVQNLGVFKLVTKLQKAFSVIEKCKKPVISLTHGLVVGGAIDLITACDFRICTKDAKFSIRETKVGIVADLGTLQRISRVCSKGFAREMAFTGSDVGADRALQFGLVNQVFETPKEMMEEAMKIAKNIASNSPLIVQATKHIMNYSDEHTTEEGLQYVRLWNSAFLKSDDLTEAFMAFFEKRKPQFKNKL